MNIPECLLEFVSGAQGVNTADGEQIADCVAYRPERVVGEGVGQTLGVVGEDAAFVDLCLAMSCELEQR
jgi:hypothetical protein